MKDFVKIGKQANGSDPGINGVARIIRLEQGVNTLQSLDSAELVTYGVPSR